MHRSRILVPLKVATITLSVGVALAGCSSASAPSESDTSTTAGLVSAPAPDAVRSWLEYDRPADYESIQSKVKVPTRDGTELDCNLFRPGQDGQADPGKHPGIVADFTPYALEYGITGHNYLAERGYNVLVCNVRGSGNSGGEFPSWFQPVEPADNYDLIEWFATQPYSTGDVGQTGSSYGSITSYRVAALNPPHLRAIMPIVSPTNIYAEWVYPGGVPTTNGTWWASGAPILDAQAHADTLQTFQDHPTYDDYWKQVATTNKLAAANVPVLNIGGYFDIFKAGGFDAFSQKPETTWLLYGPWDHVGHFAVYGKNPIDPGTDPENAISYGTALQWFDHWLGDRPEASVPPSRVTSYESTSAQGDGQWTSFDQWPAPGIDTIKLFPTAEGKLSEAVSAAGQTTYAVNPFDGPSVDVTGNTPAEEGQDQAASENLQLNESGRYDTGRTTFTLPAFDRDTTIAGTVKLHMNASITATDTYFISKLETVLPDGRVLPIETGNLRAQMRTSLEQPEPIVPGAPTQYVIDLGQTHWRFKAGEQLRVTLSGGDFPRVTPIAPAGTVTINHGPETYLEIPTLPES
ncbi:CocE/NonD family hydrolase [Rhodococcus aetherivorans]